MNDINSNKLKMYINIINACTRNEELWKGIPAFSNAYTSFSSQVLKINELNKQLQNTSKSTTEAKNAQKKVMIDYTMALVGALKAYVDVSKNTSFTEVAATTSSSILKARETDADDICMNIVDKAKSVLKQLTDFGTTKADIDAALSAINKFSDMIGKPKEDILVNKSYKEQITSIIKDADNILNKQLDGLMLRFKSTGEIFYNEYTAAKRLGGNTTKKDPSSDPEKDKKTKK